MTLSTKTKESIKTALAMTIAYGIALSMDWDRPYWAGFAVAFVSLTTVGQSMNKAALRMFGTLVAMGVSLTLIALFSQERWLFMLFLSAYMSFCCYMMSGSQRAYFWQVAAFVCVVIAMDAGADSVNAFQAAILRAQETGLGILVYTLVAIFLWPSRSTAAFTAAANDLAATQLQFYRACLDLARGQGSTQEAHRLSEQQVQHKTRFDQLLEAAEADSYEVWELRRPWRRYQQQAGELMHALERWRESFSEVHALDLQRLLPGLDAFGAALEGRLAQIGELLAGRAPEPVPQAVDLTLDKDAMRGLSHFDQASVVVTRTRMRHLEQVTSVLFEAAREIKAPGKATALPDTPRAPSRLFVLDLDRLANAVRFVAILWLAWLAVIYVNDIPGGTGLVSMAGSIGIAIANMPQLPVSKLFVPVSTGVLFAAVLYIFVMPTLSSFIGLGVLIFAATFVICYLFADPRQTLGRAFGLAMFLNIASITNEQSYNFLSVANTAMMFPVIFMIFAITAYIPVSPRPQRAFLRLLGRFFRSSVYLMSALRWNPPHPETRLERWKKAFHAREVATLPAKLGTWAPHIDAATLSGTAPQQVQTLVTSLQSLTYRMQHLLEERDTPQAQFLVKELLEDFRTWRLGIQSALQELADDPAGAQGSALRARLDSVLERLEEKIKSALNRTADGRFSDQDAEEFYRLLGAYRGLSKALVDYAGNAEGIDWAPWRQERFA
jgi:uncharacterized membrane protein YccC